MRRQLRVLSNTIQPNPTVIMSEVLVVFGATGQQGGSVINYVLKDSELSKKYRLRAVTRDTSKPVAKALEQKGVEVVQGDLDDIESLKRALRGSHTVFAVTLSVYDGGTKTREVAQGKAIADVAVAAGAKYLIFSGLPHVSNISGGKYRRVDGFDGKAEVEEYIRTLPIKSAFYHPGSFMQNFAGALAPQPAGDGTYAIPSICTPETQLPLIDVVADTGIYVGAILADPQKYEGKVFCAATKLYSYEDIVQTISKTSGKTVRYNRLPESVFRSYLPPQASDSMIDMFFYFQEFGYYGPQTEELIGWAAQNARGKPTTLEEFLEKNPLPTLQG